MPFLILEALTKNMRSTPPGSYTNYLWDSLSEEERAQCSHTHPFSYDYIYLNQLKCSQSKDSLWYFKNLFKEFTWRKHNQNALLSNWSFHHLENFYNLARNETTINTDWWIQYLLQQSGNFLPEEYDSSSATQPHPQSNLNKIDVQGWSAHIQPPNIHQNMSVDITNLKGLIASQAPLKMRNPTFYSEENEIQKMLNIIVKYKPTHILSLRGTGDSDQGQSQGRLNYWDHQPRWYSGNFFKSKIERIDEVNHIVIYPYPSISSEEAHHAEMTEFQVEDNTPIELDPEKLSTLLKIYSQYQNGLILVHCTAGIGRTGQIRLLFALLDKINDPAITDNPLKNSCDQLIEILLSEQNDAAQIKGLILQIFAEMVEILSLLRKIRYCVNSVEQYISTPVLLILLRAIQLKYVGGKIDQLFDVLKLGPIAQPAQTPAIPESNDDRSKPAEKGPTITGRKKKTQINFHLFSTQRHLHISRYEEIYFNNRGNETTYGGFYDELTQPTRFFRLPAPANSASDFQDRSRPGAIAPPPGPIPEEYSPK